jgi:threonine dehydrogenase-like Zn-dependent dehydrogenase
MRLGVGFGETVAVLGVGPAGLAYIQTARLLGAARVIAVARNDDSLQRAMSFGADAVVNMRSTDALAMLRQLTGGQGPSLVVEAAGVPETVRLAIDAVGVGGRVILYGIPGQDQTVDFPVQQIIMRQLSVHGTVGNPHVWRPLLEYVRQGRLNLKGMVTRTFALEEIGAAFAAIQDRTNPIVKAVVHPWEGEPA